MNEIKGRAWIFKDGFSVSDKLIMLKINVTVRQRLVLASQQEDCGFRSAGLFMWCFYVPALDVLWWTDSCKELNTFVFINLFVCFVLFFFLAAACNLTLERVHQIIHICRSKFTSVQLDRPTSNNWSNKFCNIATGKWKMWCKYTFFN